MREVVCLLVYVIFISLDNIITTNSIVALFDGKLVKHLHFSEHTMNVSQTMNREGTVLNTTVRLTKTSLKHLASVQRSRGIVSK